MKKPLIITSIVIVVAIIGLIIFSNLTSRKNEVETFAQVQEGNFVITVTGAGELVPEKSIDITGPVFIQTNSDNRGSGPGRGSNMHAMDLKIQDIIPEGTFVKEGDYVALLDRTNYDNTLKDEQQNLTTLQSDLELKILDTAMTMTSLRDEIKNQKYAVEEADITLAQSKYEPPATIRKAEVGLQREQRALEQLQKNYKLKARQTLNDINILKGSLAKKTQLTNDLQDYLSKFTIRAPSSGMVIYKKDRLGNKRKSGSSLNVFDNVVATLPDLSSMLSKVYISEIEISKVKLEQNVSIVVDAFPDKSYTGKITEIANVGEQLPNSDAKMFEIMIKLDGSDMTLRPGMTTGNKITIRSIKDAVYIPTECIHAGSDTIPFVYLKNRTRHIVVLGESNEKNTIIEQGLEPGTSVYLMTPEHPEQYRLTGQDLIPIIREQKKAEIAGL
jgi:HlyD family secretion protein